MQPSRKISLFVAGLASLLLVPVNLLAADFYIAQTQAGKNDGSSCGNAFAYTWFNTSSNWANPKQAGKIGPGDTAHLCGTITQALTVQGSGSAGSVITILWESGARISISSGPIFNPNGKSHLLFDGGMPCGPNTSCDAFEQSNTRGYGAQQTGIAENTDNGSSPLGHQNVNSQFLSGPMSGSGNIEIRNLIIRNLYQHTSTSDGTSSADTGTYLLNCSSSGSGCNGNLSIHDCSIHDLGNVIMLEKFTNSPTIDIYKNDFFRNNWAVEISGSGQRAINIHDNYVHDTSNWDTSSDAFHHNFIHAYMENGTSDSLGVNVYNNYSYGDWGSCCTTATFIFTETSRIANFNVFNNLVVQQCGNNQTAPAIEYWGQNGVVANNTLLGCGSVSGNTGAFYPLDGTSITFVNNLIQGYGQYVVVPATATFTRISNNAYGPKGQSGNSPWVWKGTSENGFAAWTSASGETNGVYNISSLGVNGDGTLQSGSPAIGAGANLTSVGITALDSDKAGVSRPSSGAWDIGAYEDAVLTQPRAPGGLRVVQ